MGWINERLPNGEETTYWLPDTLPEPTEEWNNSQSRKYYLKEDGNIIPHPNWYFNNTALVSDEYLYRNNNWITILEHESASNFIDLLDSIEFILNPRDQWESINEYTIKKTYKTYSIYHKPSQPIEESYKTKIVETVTYDEEKKLKILGHDVVELSEEEILERENIMIKSIRKYRDVLLKKTDFYVTIALEKKLELSENFIVYRQYLRDFVQNIDLEILSGSEISALQIANNQSTFLLETKSIEEIQNCFSFFPNLPDNIFVEE